MTSGYPSGPTIFKLLLQMVIIDTISTTGKLRDNLSYLDTYMTNAITNTYELNCYVKLNYHVPKSHVERCDDIISKLIKG